LKFSNPLRTSRSLRLAQFNRKELEVR